MVRAVAGHDHDKAERVLGWPLVELLHAFVDGVLRPQARHAYETDLHVWAAVAPYSTKSTKPPAVPTLLRPRSKPSNG